MDINSINDVLYEVYIPGLQSTIYEEEFWTSILKAANKIEKVGSNFNVKVQTGYSWGIGMSSDVTGALPTPGECQFQTYRGTPKHIDAQIKYWRKLIDMSDGFRTGAIKLVDAEMRGVESALKCTVERMGIGDAGVTPIACVASATVTNETDTWVTVTVDDGGGTAICGTRWPVRYFKRGIFVDILTSGHASVSGTATEGLQIQTISGSNVIKLKCATNAAADTLAALLADGQLIYQRGGYNKEFEGMKSLFGKTTNKLWGSADADRTVTNNEYLIPHVCRVSDAGLIETGAATGIPKEWTILNIVEVLDFLQNVRNAKLNDLVMVAEKAIMNKFIVMKQNSGMYVMENATIEGWPYQTVMCEGVKMVCPPLMFSNAISINPIKLMTKYLTREIDFVTENGGLWQRLNGYDGATAYLSGTMEYGCENFEVGGTIYDLKDAYSA
jgi:hypothetical protein